MSIDSNVRMAAMTRSIATLIVTAFSVALIPALAAPPASGPKQVVQEYWKSEINGGLLTREDWIKASHFFIRPSFPEPPRTIYVIPNEEVGGVEEMANTENWAEVDAGTIELGELDSALRFKNLSRVETRLLVRFDVVLTTKHWELEPPYGAMGHAITGPPEWRIVSMGDRSSMCLTLDAAIKYVDRQRGISTNAAIKKNAGAALMELNALKSIRFR